MTRTHLLGAGLVLFGLCRVSLVGRTPERGTAVAVVDFPGAGGLWGPAYSGAASPGISCTRTNWSQSSTWTAVSWTPAALSAAFRAS